MTIHNRGEILLNLMYNGKYIQKSSNIGYEIINLVQADNGENYIYVLPYGTYHKKHNIETILLVRKVDDIPVLEVLGKATGLEKIYDPLRNSLKNQKKLSVSVKYGGVPIKDIFRDCTEQDVYITFKAESVIRTSKRIYICYDDELGSLSKQNVIKNDIYSILSSKDVISVKNVGLPKQAQKQYFLESDKDNYSILLELIDNEDNWQKDNVPQVDSSKIKNLGNFKPNLFDICGIADRELAFSNVLSYFISLYPELVREFAKEYFDEDICLNDGKSLEVVRECEANIDLLLKCESHVIVIENKIRSGINGIDEREDRKFNQLVKYHEYIESEYSSSMDKRKHSFIILKPDYSSIDIDQYQSTIINDRYQVLNYSSLYTFLLKKLEIRPYKDDFYLQEFVKAMYKHTKGRYDDQYEIMFRKFIMILNKRKLENNYNIK